ncbi:zona pellucida sperm-binding protein 3 [Lampris incognitus]|uniref:zona pellucida sperm-binding protein 3 n=1 Tax=Lampris incognitus TaxID=2546036 RepID=UPI0024B5E27A|nr:zona pellucida sperm-binding protein 3 [Lampris incognitus]
MGLFIVGFFLLMCCSAYCHTFRGVTEYGPFIRDPEFEWNEMKRAIAAEKAQEITPKAKFWRSGFEARRVPEYLRIPASADQKERFKPEKGTRPLPESVKHMLLVTAGPATTATTSKPDSVELLCHVDRMYVRVKRALFQSKTAYKYLTLGTCPVNAATEEHYYLLYLLKTNCGFNRQSYADYVSFNNVVSFKPDPTSPIVRELPFQIPVQCNYHRIHHSYRVGFYPKLQGGTVFKGLKSQTGVLLIPQDASGQEITGSKMYTLGQPMYFEAKLSYTAAQTSGDPRVYVNKCFVTATSDPNSAQKYAVIDNQGCMIDGKMTEQSKFLTHTSKLSQKFRIGAFVFQDMASNLASPKRLYMHCEITLGTTPPTPSWKACNYDSATKKWKELYGDDSVCICCDSSCSTVLPKASRAMVSSHSWQVDYSKHEKDESEPQFKSFEPNWINEGDDEDLLTLWEHGSKK